MSSATSSAAATLSLRNSRTRTGRTPGRTRRLSLELVHLEPCLLRRLREPTLDALLHRGHQDAVAEPHPATLGHVHRHDRPAASRRTGNVNNLPLRQFPTTGMHGGD